MASMLGCLLLAVTTGAGPAAASPAGRIGWATTFVQHWAPYGNCGMPSGRLDTPDYLALNVYSSSGSPGAYDGGHNCGRFVRVVIGRKCAGVANSGALNAGFCRGGTLVNDRYTGAVLTFEVADSCPDDNGWCRQDPDHLDLSQPSLARFRKHGARVHGLGASANWNNRQVHWSFVSAPSYRGGVRIGFQQDAQRYYPVVLLSHLRDGVHRVTYLQDGHWHAAQTRGTEGQVFALGGTVDGGTRYRIRIYDAHNHLINDGRSYAFGFPASCRGTCTKAYTPVHYTTS